MPFKSTSQRGYLSVHEPALAKKWAHEYPGQKHLPKHVAKKQASRHAMLSQMKGGR